MNSETIGTLAKALSVAQGAMKPADMDNKGNYGKYASLASLWESCRSALAANGLAVVQQTDFHDGELVLVTKLIHESGEWMGSVLPVKPVQATPQGLGSALTYARRYSLSALVGLSADDDDDGQAATTPQHKPQPQRQAQTQGKSTPPPVTEVTEPPLDNPFDDDNAGHEAISRGEPITDKQLKMLHAVGIAVYADGWATKRAQLVEAVTKGEHRSAADLTKAEAKTLIDGLVKKQAALHSAPSAAELSAVPEMAH